MTDLTFAVARAHVDPLLFQTGSSRTSSQQHTEPRSPTAAGLAIIAADSGRVLMQQRTNEAVHENGEVNKAPGMWEFPGGNAELADNGDLFTTARREWEEETGLILPPGVLTGQWTSGVYTGFVWQVPDEASVTLNLDGPDRHVLNPDDPDGDHIEVMAWWDPTTLARNPVVREELRKGTDFSKLRVRAPGDVQEFVELLSFADFVPDEHPRDAHGKFAKGGGEQGGDHKLGDTRVPEAHELVDADKSELSKWMLEDHPIAVVPSDATENMRQEYKAAIAEHLGNVLIQESVKNQRIGQEIGAPDALPDVDGRRIVDIGHATTPDEIRSAVEKAYANYPKELAYMKNDPELQEYFRRADEGNMAMRLRVSNYVGNRLSQAQPNTLDKDMATRFASDFIHTWAETSADTHPGALAIQEMAAKEFGIPMAKHLQSAIDDNRVGIDSTLAQQGETIKTLLHAQYDWTQQELAKAGIKEMSLYRGAAIYRPTAATEDTKINLQPLSSFSVEYETASSFSGHGENDPAVIAARVPASRIFSTAKTGFGCLSEGEVVVLGGHDLPAVIAWKKDYGDLDTIGQMQDRVAAGIESAPPPITHDLGRIRDIQAAVKVYDQMLSENNLAMANNFVGIAKDHYGTDISALHKAHGKGVTDAQIDAALGKK
jgi:8-oxo-dGTP pyrophosphatase MutT (NUDIX family)